VYKVLSLIGFGIVHVIGGNVISNYAHLFSMSSLVHSCYAIAQLKSCLVFIFIILILLLVPFFEISSQACLSLVLAYIYCTTMCTLPCLQNVWVLAHSKDAVFSYLYFFPFWWHFQQTIGPCSKAHNYYFKKKWSSHRWNFGIMVN